MLFANRNEFLRDSSRIEPIPPNIRSEIVSESGLTRRASRLEKKKLTPHESPRINKKSIRGDSAIRGLCGIGVLGIRNYS